MKTKRDKKYSTDEFVHGTELNEFLKETLKNLTPGKILLLGEGKGRNSVMGQHTVGKSMPLIPL